MRKLQQVLVGIHLVTDLLQQADIRMRSPGLQKLVTSLFQIVNRLAAS